MNRGLAWRLKPRRLRRSWMHTVLALGVLIYLILQFMIIAYTMPSHLHNFSYEHPKEREIIQAKLFSFPTLISPSTRQASFSYRSSKSTQKPPLIEQEDDDPKEEVPEVPVFLGENPKYKPHRRSKNQHSLHLHYAGQLGNSMFAYASGYGISRTNWMNLVWPRYELLRNYFHLEAGIQSEGIPPTGLYSLLEDGPNLYDDRTERLNYDIDIHLLGFFQSWRYFDRHQEDIKRQFTFKREIIYLADNFLIESYEANFIGRNINFTEVTFIGIHIRRGDYLSQENIDRGYTVASAEYFETAIIYFMSLYNRVLFIVCSDDINWAESNLPSDKAPMAFSRGHYVIEDLAILAKCNHTIMSVGTFGWWAGWLAGGRVLYYADFPKRKSALSEAFNPRDFFPPHWKGLTFR